jgi:CheY-like chemotaxis protein
MNKNGPVIVVEDDEDDRELLDMIFKTLGYKNPVVFFSDGHKALEYLNKTDVSPFLILSDINMPKIDGFELRSQIHTSDLLHLKCIPYLFFTTSANKKAVVDAYTLSAQGFFVKPNGYAQLESTVRKIMEYWKECIAPGDLP